MNEVVDGDSPEPETRYRYVLKRVLAHRAAGGAAEEEDKVREAAGNAFDALEKVWLEVEIAHMDRTAWFAEPIKAVLALIREHAAETPPPDYVSIGCLAWNPNPAHQYDGTSDRVPSPRAATGLRGGDITVMGPRAPWQWTKKPNRMEVRLCKYGPTGIGYQVMVPWNADDTEELKLVLIEFLGKLAEPDCNFGRVRFFMIVYEVEGCGTNTAGPYTEAEVEEHERDIRSFEGVSSVRRRPA